MAAPRTYPIELKERALRLWRSEQPRRPIAHVARELGLNPETLRTWIRQEEADRGERGDRPTPPRLRSCGGCARRTWICAAPTRFCGRRAPISPRSSTRPGDGHDLRARSS
jgi:transposase